MESKSIGKNVQMCMCVKRGLQVVKLTLLLVFGDVK